MNDCRDIRGIEPKNVATLYSIYPTLYPQIDNGSFSILNYPDIKVYEIIFEGDKVKESIKQLEEFKIYANDEQMGDIYEDYNAVLEVYGIIEVDEIVNLPGNPMTIPEKNASSHNIVYRMKDGSLKVTYFTGDLYYDIEDCKKVAIKGMKSVFEFADKTYAKIGEQIEKEKKLWEKTFLEYPHLVI